MDIVFAPGTLTFKVIGGIVDLFVVVGPTPADVVAQYTRVIGRPHMIPYWVRACRDSGRGPRSHLESANPRCSFLYPLTRIRPFCWFLQQVLGYHQYVRDEPRTARGVVKLTCAREGGCGAVPSEQHPAGHDVDGAACALVCPHTARRARGAHLSWCTAEPRRTLTTWSATGTLRLARHGFRAPT